MGFTTSVKISAWGVTLAATVIVFSLSFPHADNAAAEVVPRELAARNLAHRRIAVGSARTVSVCTEENAVLFSCVRERIVARNAAELDVDVRHFQEEGFDGHQHEAVCLVVRRRDIEVLKRHVVSYTRVAFEHLIIVCGKTATIVGNVRVSAVLERGGGRAKGEIEMGILDYGSFT